MKKHLMLLLCFGSAMANANAEPGVGLEAALTAALSSHPAVAVKQAGVRAKGFAGDTARSQRYPSLVAQVQQAVTGPNDAYANPITLRARQPLWSFGRIDNNIAYADADMLAERLDLQRVRRQLIDSTAVAYAKVLGSLQRQRMAIDNLAEHEALHQQIHRRQLGQLASAADVRLAAARVAQAKAMQQRYDGERSLAETELLALTQVTVVAIAEVQAQLLPTLTAPELDDLAQRSSAELRYKQQLIELARANAAQARSAAMPTVYLQAERNTGAGQTPSLPRIGVLIEASLDGMGLATKGRSAESEARLAAAEEDLRVSRNELSRSLKSLWQSRQMQAGLMAAQLESTQAVTDLLASYQRQYAAGTKAWMDVLNIQRELTEQRLQWAQASNDWLIHSLRLSAMTAGLDAAAGLPKD